LQEEVAKPGFEVARQILARVPQHAQSCTDLLGCNILAQNSDMVQEHCSNSVLVEAKQNRLENTVKESLTSLPLFAFAKGHHA
jgi:hypothetical protein